jgi:urease accessory protein
MANRFRRPLTAALLLLPTASFAHPGHEASTFLDGFAHPLGGIDHLLAMIAVGILASRFDRSARWTLPLAFMGAMSIGAITASVGVALTSVELMIALSLVVFGAAIAIVRRLPTVLTATAVSLFALFHGYAHGAEMGGSSLLVFGGGFILSTALLHGAGLWVTLRARDLGQRAHLAIRVAGCAIAGVGALLMPFAFA